MSVSKSFNEILNEVLTAYKNMGPILQLDTVRLKAEVPDVYNRYLVQTQPDVSEGTVLYMRSAVLASMLWGLYTEASKAPDQVFAETAIRTYLDKQAGEFGLPTSGKTDAALAAEVLEIKRSKRMGGNKYDYIAWSKEVSVMMVDNTPSFGDIANHGFVSFNATSCVDDDTDTVGWSSYESPADSFISVHYSDDINRQYLKLRLYSTGEGDEVYEVGYSDDGNVWMPVAIAATMVSGWNDIVWDSVGSHAYWQLKLVSPASAASDITEMEWYEGPEYVVDAYVQPLAQGDGTFDVIIQSSLSNGVASADLISAVQSHLNDRRTVCSGFETGMRVVTPSIDYQVIFVYGSGLSFDPVQTRLDVIAYVNSLLPGQTLYRAQLIALAVQNGAANALVSNPAADVVPTVNPFDGEYQMIRAGSVSVS